MPEDSELSVYDLLGLNDLDKSVSPEEEFYERMTTGAAPRIDNLLYFLKHEVSHFKHLKENHVTLSVDEDRYIWLMIKYYLQMMHLTRFTFSAYDEKGDDLPKLDLEETTNLFASYDGVQKIIRESHKTD